ncbi:MAG: metal ABC transporter substrate-binding protein [Candidatus Micrarchaeia archaeon]
MKFGFWILLFVSIVLFFGCISNEQKEQDKLQVVVSFYPLYDFTENIAKDKIELSLLIPAGSEPHSYEPKPSDIKKLNEADIFIYNGAGLEPWIDNLLAGVENPNLLIVDTSNGIELIEGHHHEKEHELGEIEEEHMGMDPHIWLDPKNAITQVENIKESLIEKDPENKEIYQKNAYEYANQLEELDMEIKEAFKTCRKKEILITHETLGYFCKSYGCIQIPITGISHDEEPSAKDLMDIIDQANEKNITYIFFESLIDPKSADTIATEINGKIMVFNTIHGLSKEEQEKNEDYISLMRKNIINIKEALDCN